MIDTRSWTSFHDVKPRTLLFVSGFELRDCMRGVLHTSFVVRRMASEGRRASAQEKDWLPIDWIYRELTTRFTRTNKPIEPVRMDEGLKNAADMLWGAIREIPRIHRRLYPDTTLTPDDFQKMCRGSIDLIVAFARSHMVLFSVAIANMRDPFNIVDRFPEARYLSVVPGKRHSKIGIDEQRRAMLLEAAQVSETVSGQPLQSYYKEDCVTGCPALYARAPNGKNVVVAMHEWTMQICERWLFPHLSDILQRKVPIPLETHLATLQREAIEALSKSRAGDPVL